MVNYRTEVRFGYGPYARSGDAAPLEMPGTKETRYPDLTPSTETVPVVLLGRAAYSKLADDGDAEGYEKAVGHYYRDNHARYRENALERLKFSVRSDFGFFERLVYFWENHLAIMTSNKTTYTIIVPGYENEAIRPHVDGYFRDLLTAAIMHPAMLLTLDQHVSIGRNSPIGLVMGRGPNENLGRELLELHTLGADGGYDQADVEQLSGLLTGLRVNYAKGRSGFYYTRSQPGSFDVLGKSYGGLLKSKSDIVEVLHDLSLHPSTAQHICRKLARHFISDNPPQALVAEMAARFTETEGYLPAVYEVLTAFDDPAYRMAKVKTPLDFIVSGLRALDAPELALSTDSSISLGQPAMMMASETGGTPALPDLTIGALDAMGHRLWGPPGPDGWPDRNPDWLHGVGLTQRMAWASEAASLATGSAQEFLDHALGDLASAETRRAVDNANSALEGVTLALMSPEFNRR